MRRYAFLWIILMLVSGCSALPEILQVPKKVELLPFDEVGDMDLTPTNIQARWGGVIAKTVNHSDRTLLEVVYFPLDQQGKPEVNKESPGRFRVYVGDFVDPVVYRPGRSVTVLGTLGVREQGMVGDYVYDFTVLHCLEMYLWRNDQELNIQQPQSAEPFVPALITSYQ